MISLKAKFVRLTEEIDPERITIIARFESVEPGRIDAIDVPITTPEGLESLVAGEVYNVRIER